MNANLLTSVTSKGIELSWLDKRQKSSASLHISPEETLIGAFMCWYNHVDGRALPSEVLLSQ